MRSLLRGIAVLAVLVYRWRWTFRILCAIEDVRDAALKADPRDMKDIRSLDEGLYHSILRLIDLFSPSKFDELTIKLERIDTWE